MRRLVVLASLALAARLAHAQGSHGVQVVGTGGRVNVIVMNDSAALAMLMPYGSTYVVRSDSVTMATLADNAELLTDSTHGARLAYVDAKIGQLQGVTFLRLSADSSSPYRVIAEDGERTENLTLSGETARIVFGAMRGEAQRRDDSNGVHVIHDVSGLHFQVRHPPRELPGTPVRAHSFVGPTIHGNGEVTLSFLVDTTGRVDPKSIQAVGGPVTDLTRAAADNLLHTRFDPAQVEGHRIAERIQKKFEFTLTSQ
ncbi:MAG TPA: hypothetical protein VNV25_21985 [Gemmatimonadaceae bacterium]|jgi:hypothetical protein|nr:hypothetical protein [Gemmatimonadaceae bacterium]